MPFFHVEFWFVQKQANKKSMSTYELYAKGTHTMYERSWTSLSLSPSVCVSEISFVFAFEID